MGTGTSKYLIVGSKMPKLYLKPQIYGTLATLNDWHLTQFFPTLPLILLVDKLTKIFLLLSIFSNIFYDPFCISQNKVSIQA